MKLVCCKKCSDIFNLRFEIKTCKCGSSGGQYVDNLYAEIWGDFCTPIGFANDTFIAALRKQPEKGWGERFEAFVIPKECDTIKRVKHNEQNHPTKKNQSGQNRPKKEKSSTTPKRIKSV